MGSEAAAIIANTDANAKQANVEDRIIGSAVAPENSIRVGPRQLAFASLRSSETPGPETDLIPGLSEPAII